MNSSKYFWLDLSHISITILHLTTNPLVNTAMRLQSLGRLHIDQTTWIKWDEDYWTLVLIVISHSLKVLQFGLKMTHDTHSI